MGAVTRQPAPKGETHEQWADRVIRNGPPPPPRVLDLVARMKANAEKMAKGGSG